jgi:hypothetical protein
MMAAPFGGSSCPVPANSLDGHVPHTKNPRRSIVDTHQVLRGLGFESLKTGIRRYPRQESCRDDLGTENAKAVATKYHNLFCTIRITYRESGVELSFMHRWPETPTEELFLQVTGYAYFLLQYAHEEPRHTDDG